MGLLWIPSSLFLSSHISLSCSRLALELGLVRGHGMEIGGLVYHGSGGRVGLDWWRLVGFSMEIGGLPMMGRSRSLMIGWMWRDVGGGVDLVVLWVKWFRRSGFCGFADLGFVCVL